MLRTLLLLVVLIIVIFIALVMTGLVNLRQDGNSVSLQTKDIEVGTTPTNVQVPAVRIEDRQVELPSISVTDGNSAANAQ